MRKWVCRGPTAWITSRLHRFGLEVGSVIPAGFDAYARIFHPATDQGGAPVRWHDIAAANGRSIPEELQDPAFNGIPAQATARAAELWNGPPPLGSMPLSVATRLLEMLRASTSTPKDCWFAVWHGFSGLDIPAGTGEAFSIPGREFYLVHGEMTDVVNTLSTAAWSYQSPNLWWPADRAWCVATEVDFPWTYVGGTAACVTAILND